MRPLAAAPGSPGGGEALELGEDEGAQADLDDHAEEGAGDGVAAGELGGAIAGEEAADDAAERPGQGGAYDGPTALEHIKADAGGEAAGKNANGGAEKATDEGGAGDGHGMVVQVGLGALVLTQFQRLATSWRAWRRGQKPHP